MTLLDLIKSIENRLSLWHVVEDLDAKRFLAAWDSLPRAVNDRPAEPGETWRHAHSWLWEKQTLGIEEIEDLAEQAGMTYSQALSFFKRFKQANLIYPDGTISDGVRKLLLTEVGAVVNQLMRGFPHAPRAQAGIETGGTGIPQPAAHRIHKRQAPTRRANKIRRRSSRGNGGAS